MVGWPHGGAAAHGLRLPPGLAKLAPSASPSAYLGTGLRRQFRRIQVHLPVQTPTWSALRPTLTDGMGNPYDATWGRPSAKAAIVWAVLVGARATGQAPPHPPHPIPNPIGPDPSMKGAITGACGRWHPWHCSSQDSERRKREVDPFGSRKSAISLPRSGILKGAKGAKFSLTPHWPPSIGCPAATTPSARCSSCYFRP